MLSVVGRDEVGKMTGLGMEGRGGGIGRRRGEMEGNVLEEGEACSLQEKEIDPDDLSYIDDKIQDVLGHFQKDFEGGVSAETLGAKFGGYGSFLPAYQRSPSVLSHAKSPANVVSHNVSRLLHSSPTVAACNNISGPATEPITKASTACLAHLTEKSGKRDTSIITACNAEDTTQHESFGAPVTNNDQMSLKVRIKVGSDNLVSRDNPSIYSDLGLDVSPSPSPCHSPGGSRELSSESTEAFFESPNTILQIMTCLLVPGGFLLSPLSEGLLHSRPKGGSFSKKSKAGMPQKSMPVVCAASSDLSLHLKDDKICFTHKKIKSCEQSQRLEEAGGLTSEDNVTAFLNNENGCKTPATEKVVSRGQDLSISSSSRCLDAIQEKHVIGDSVRENHKYFDASNQPNKIEMKEKVDVSDTTKDSPLELMKSLRTVAAGNLEKGTIHLEGRPHSRDGLSDKAYEEAIGDNQNSSYSIGRVRKSEKTKNYDKIQADSSKHKERKICTSSEELEKEKPAQLTSGEKTDVKTMQVTGQDSGVGRMAKGSQNNDTASIESAKEIPSTKSSVASKERKNVCQTKGARLETKSKFSKSHNELNKGHNVESHRDFLVGAHVEQYENQKHMLGSSRSTEKYRSGVDKYDNLLIAEPAMDSSAPVNGTALTSDASTTMPPLVFIEDVWVCCDICQQWRLLPYGTNPANLPKTWQCSMQVWLPGLNTCNISEDETTKAFHELYQAALPAGDTNLTADHTAAATSITTAETMKALTGKKKHGLMDEADLPIDSALIHLPNFSKNMKGYSANKTITGSTGPIETDPLIKLIPGETSKSIDFGEQKHIHKSKENHKLVPYLKDGGDLLESGEKHSKSVNKRELVLDGVRASKKKKKDRPYYSVRDTHSDIDTAGKVAVNGDSDLFGIAPKIILQSDSDHSSSKNMKSKSASAQKWREKNNLLSSGKHKESCTALEKEKPSKYGSNDKKWKLKDWRETQANEETLICSKQFIGNKTMVKEALTESELRQKKKVKVAKSEGKESSSVIKEEKMEKKVSSARIALFRNRQHLSNEIDSLHHTAEEQMVANQGNQKSGQGSDIMDVMKRDVTYGHLLAAATSSSSKVSGSQKGKGKQQETRGSPVESVSSSPMRILNIEDKFAKRSSSSRKDEVISMIPSGSPKRFSDGEVDGGNDHIRIRTKVPSSNACTRYPEICRTAESGSLDSLKGSHGYQERETNYLSGVEGINQISLKKGKRDEILSVGLDHTNTVHDDGNVSDEPNKYLLVQSDQNHTEDKRNGSGVNISVKSSHSREHQGNFKLDSGKRKFKISDSYTEKGLYSMRTDKNCSGGVGSDCLNSNKEDDLRCHSEQHNDHHVRNAIGGNRSILEPLENVHQELSHQKRKPSSLLISEGMHYGAGMQSAHPDKYDLEKKGCILQTATKPVMGSGDAVNGESSRSAKLSRLADGQNGAHPSLLRHSTPSLHGSCSPVKSDPTVNALLKEARNLKHTANRLKTRGLEHESSGIFFESALQFLHVASLMESPNTEHNRQGELIPSSQMLLLYYETAKFCRFCALEYERLKEMAAAALAYKCTEVAFLKVAYYKQPSTSKDRLELQVALDAAVTGESPSSSASDVDNLNNQGGIDKVASAKAGASPQIASSHAISARNHPHVMRLLTYTKYLNSAFEATRKSQNAIACIDLIKNGADCVSPVREVLDFNFHNVEGLLRLVRLAMNSIGH